MPSRDKGRDRDRERDRERFDKRKRSPEFKLKDDLLKGEEVRSLLLHFINLLKEQKDFLIIDSVMRVVLL